MSADDSWRTPQIRQQIRTKLDEVIGQSPQSTTNVPELETQIFGKAKSREEYLRFAAKLIRYLQDSSAKKTHIGIQQAVGGQPLSSSAPDPISSLQSLTSSQNTGEMLGGAMSVALPNLSESSIMNVGPVSSVPVTLAMSAAGVGQVSQMQVNQPSPMVQRVNMSQNRMIVNQMLLPNAGNVQISTQHSAQRAAMIPGNIQALQRLRQPSSQPSVQVQQNVSDVSYYPGQNVQSSPAHTQFQSNINQTFHNSTGVMMSTQNQPTLTAHHPQLTQMQCAATMAPSPSTYVPSPSQGLLTSPMSVGIINQRAPLSSASAASPSSLNTPVMIQNQSPVMRPINEDQAYLDKLKQLSKYIEPLRNMITRIDRDESMSNERKKDLHKINNLLEIISDPNRRCSMETLLKCEQVLEKMEFKFIRTDTSNLANQSQSSVHSKLQDHNIGQPLLDAVKNNIKKPFFNHTLHRTFGSAVAALTNSTYRIPTLPPKRITNVGSDVPDVLQGEIARLDQRFKVQMDLLQHPGSKTINLICRLDDVDLPSVPSIAIHVPVGYPNMPPQCRMDLDEYNASSFLQQIQKSFYTSIEKLNSNYSITTLLHRWEISVRQAVNVRER